MPVAPERRAPAVADLLLVLAELEGHGVRYALLGGAAMAVHGFPRMTRDIDCLFPVDARNNARLMAALKELGTKLRFDFLPDRKSLDQGFSTAAEGEIALDILFVAASRRFEDYARHIEEREIDGVRFKVLDVDGMLMSKETDRAVDIPDRQRLRGLKG
ncbi:MAG TPA: hypothetical protein VFV55_11355 [Usitatibacteraceae bacterium]|nr:hypothetical protein [Usitatibacteraceae bacterium]